MRKQSAKPGFLSSELMRIYSSTSFGVSSNHLGSFSQRVITIELRYVDGKNLVAIAPKCSRLTSIFYPTVSRIVMLITLIFDHKAFSYPTL